MAAGLETASLRGQGRTDDAAAALEGLAGPDGILAGGNARAMAELVRSYWRAGDLAAARRYLDGRARPGSRPASPGRLLHGRARPACAGDPAAAEAGYRAVIADDPAAAAGPPGALRLPRRPGPGGRGGGGARRRARRGARRARRCASPRPGSWKQKGDIDGAIAAYEALYAADSGSPVLANNLASLLASYRDDPASLERAFAIARRLRGTDVP